MSTRTAIFKEEQDGTYTGVYVHWDGYIDGVGYTLHNYYQSFDKTSELIDHRKPLSALGAKSELIKLDVMENRPMAEDGALQYTERMDNLTEYYKADTLEDIRNFKCLTYDGDGQLEGYHDNSGEFIPSVIDNNGYIYVQQQNGEWLISCDGNKGGIVDEMSAFEPLSKHFAEDEYERRCRKYEDCQPPQPH